MWGWEAGFPWSRHLRHGTAPRGTERRCHGSTVPAEAKDGVRPRAPLLWSFPPTPRGPPVLCRSRQGCTCNGRGDETGGVPWQLLGGWEQCRESSCTSQDLVPSGPPAGPPVLCLPGTPPPRLDPGSSTELWGAWLLRAEHLHPHLRGSASGPGHRRGLRSIFTGHKGNDQSPSAGDRPARGLSLEGPRGRG